MSKDTRRTSWQRRAVLQGNDKTEQHCLSPCQVPGDMYTVPLSLLMTKLHFQHHNSYIQNKVKFGGIRKRRVYFCQNFSFSFSTAVLNSRSG